MMMMMMIKDAFNKTSVSSLSIFTAGLKAFSILPARDGCSFFFFHGHFFHRHCPDLAAAERGVFFFLSERAVIVVLLYIYRRKTIAHTDLRPR